MQWINNNIVTVVVATIIVIAIFVLAYNNRKGLLNKAALYAVSKAEEAWGSKTGRIKFAEVYTYLTEQYPIVTFFFTEEKLTEIIENALTEMKKILTTKQGFEVQQKTSQEN